MIILLKLVLWSVVRSFAGGSGAQFGSKLLGLNLPLFRGRLHHSLRHLNFHIILQQRHKFFLHLLVIKLHFLIEVISRVGESLFILFRNIVKLLEHILLKLCLFVDHAFYRISLLYYDLFKSADFIIVGFWNADDSCVDGLGNLFFLGQFLHERTAATEGERSERRPIVVIIDKISFTISSK